MTDNAPGWQPDPTGRHDHRYWDGSTWTDNVSDAGVASTDAYDVVDAPAAEAPVEADEAPTEVVPETSGWAEPTSTFPAVSGDPTSTWASTPAPPAPPAYTPPPAPTGPVGPDGSGGSKRGLLIGGGILAVVAIVVALLLLGGDDEDESVTTQLAAQFEASSDLSSDQAACVADHVVDEVGAENLEDMDFTADELAAVAAGSLESCDIDPADFSGTGDDGEDPSGEEGTYGSDEELDALYDECEAGDYQACDDLYDASPSGSEYEEFADTCGDRNEPAGYCVDIYEDGGDSTDDGAVLPEGEVPPGFEDELAEVYENSMGLPAEKAECLAGKIADAIQSGELSEEESMSEIFSFFADCDIDMGEISGNG